MRTLIATIALVLAAALPADHASAQSASSTSAGSFDAALDAVRGQAGLGGVRSDRRLAAAAQAYAETMAATGHFAHTGADGSTHQTRAQAAGCRSGFIGENIAWGQRTAQATFDGWMASSGHRANMLGANFGVFGLGQSNGMWVIMFADRC